MAGIKNEPEDIFKQPSIRQKPESQGEQRTMDLPHCGWDTGCRWEKGRSQRGRERESEHSHVFRPRVPWLQLESSGEL